MDKPIQDKLTISKIIDICNKNSVYKIDEVIKHKVESIQKQLNRKK